MEGIYTVKINEGTNNETIKRFSVFLWDDFLKEDTFRGTADVRMIGDDGFIKGNTFQRVVCKDKNGLFIQMYGKDIYLKDFDVTPVDALIEKLKYANEHDNFVWPFCQDEIWATFYRHFDEIGLIADMPVYDMIVPGLGVAFTSDASTKVLCAPFYNNRYGQNELDYKIQFQCVVPELQTFVSKRTMYFSDFCSFLTRGLISLVNLRTNREALMEEYGPDNYSLCNQFEKKKGIVSKVADKLLNKGKEKQKIPVPFVMNV